MVLNQAFFISRSANIKKYRKSRTNLHVARCVLYRVLTVILYICKCEYTNLTKEEKDMYDNSMKYKWDNKHVLDTAIEEAKLEEARDIAREMIKDGVPVEQISKFTKLSIDEIGKIKSKLNN